jgi:hypothetical protein
VTSRILSAPPDLVDLEHARHDDVAQPLADVLDPLDHQAQVVERGTQRPDVVGEWDEVTEPAERSTHGGRGQSFSLIG